MGGRYDTEHMEEPRSWRPGGILRVHKGAQHAQAYIDRPSKCQRSKCRARYTVRKGENQDCGELGEPNTSFTNKDTNILLIVRKKKEA